MKNKKERRGLEGGSEAGSNPLGTPEESNTAQANAAQASDETDPLSGDGGGERDNIFPAVISEAGEGLTPTEETPPRGPSKPFPIVGVGASAGGLDAFTELLRALPADTGMAFVLVQHMDPKHESILNWLLSKETGMPVSQVTDGMEVEPDHVYVIPPNRDMTIREGILRLLDRPKGLAAHTPIDSFFSALAQDQKSSSIGVILSGTGSDGTLGCKSIKAAGGLTFAQDEQSAKFSGMPASATNSGCVDLQLPIQQIAEELRRAVGHPFLHSAEPIPLLEEQENGNFGRILSSLRISSGVDFSYYKPNTIRRRVARRMVLNKAQTLGQYVDYLDTNPKEAGALFEDILIHVTSFFREPEVFRALEQTVFPKMREKVSAGESLRIWAPGCSTGEEVYSIAISLLEVLGDLAQRAHIQIFGTDISNQNIELARVAIYPEGALANLGADRLSRFFSRVENGYQVSKMLRDMCIFARHDLGKDPPFSKLDLISCRNVLIYLGSIMQKRAISIFHYALKPDGYLLLGKSETITLFSNLFDLEDRPNKIYTRRDAPAQPFPNMVAVGYEGRGGHTRAFETGNGYDARKEAERIVLDRYAPPGLLLNDQLQILHFQGDVTIYLKPSMGQASFDVVKMIRPELVLEVRKAVSEAKKTGLSARRDPVQWEFNDSVHETSVEAVPIRGARDGFDCLVLFVEQPRPAAQPYVPRKTKGKATQQEEELALLKSELDSTREHLKSIVEDAEASNEELRSANEEVLSSNEELQSTNEELETAKEELQSANEELTTLNEEMHNRNEELMLLANDLSGLLAGIEIPVLILGADRKIRRYTPAAERVFDLIPSDIGRPIGNIKANVQLPDLDHLVSEALRQPEGTIEREVQDLQGRWYSLRMKRYQTRDGDHEAVILALVDIDSSKRASDAIVETVRTPLVVLDSGLQVITGNPAFYEEFGLEPSAVENRSLLEIKGGAWNIAELRRLLLEILPNKTAVRDFELVGTLGVLGRRRLLINARQMFLRGAGKPLILLAMEDDTERWLAGNALVRRESSLRASNRKLSSLSGELIVRSERTARKIARDLHDAFAHGLLALSLRLTEMEKTTGGPVTKKKLHQLSAESRRLATEIEAFSRGLHPAVLDELGLAASIRIECAACSKRYHIPVSFTDKSAAKSIPQEIAAGLYRIAQEALRNIGQHSRAKKAGVLLEATRSEITLTISDDGDGFEVDQGRKMGGLGLTSMEERARLLAGSMTVHSEKGGGAKLEVRVPRRDRKSKSAGKKRLTKGRAKK